LSFEPTGIRDYPNCIGNMPKGCLAANISVRDAEKFKEFAGMAAPAIKNYGGKVWS
jgi:hypothetical protein